MLTVKLTVNGQSYEHKGEGSIESLAAEYNAPLDKVVFLVNNETVPREKRAAVLLKEDDSVEIITMAGGG
jgi:thiamine biosynthesis protein ThiS